MTLSPNPQWILTRWFLSKQHSRQIAESRALLVIFGGILVETGAHFKGRPSRLFAQSISGMPLADEFQRLLPAAAQAGRGARLERPGELLSACTRMQMHNTHAGG